MFISNVPVIQMTILATLFSGSSSVCSPDQFGPNCAYKCWCPQNSCQQDGECTGGIRCVDGWFGPSCQYQDIVNKYSTSAPDWLKDGDDQTCNVNVNDKTATISFQESFYIPWMRIVVKSRSKLLLFKLEFNKSNQFCEPKLYFVNPTTVDLTCNLSNAIFEIQVSGKALGYMCSLYASGGRNMALSQSAIQTGGYTEDGFLHVASLAIDGETGGLLGKKTCAQTSVSQSAGWVLFYSRPTVIYRVLIHNQFEAAARLKAFSLRTFTNDSREIEAYTEPGETLDVYNVSLTNREQIARLVISRKPLLMVCEVETFGDPVCPGNKWGLNCSYDCRCLFMQTCFPITGQCSHACPVGLYGYQCTETCPENCVGQTCSDSTGYCDVCVDGYTGDRCDTACDPGTHGDGCDSMCPENCKDTCDDEKSECLTCDIEIGTCFFNACLPTNGSCISCDNGFYGEKCEAACSTGCVDDICHITDGSCISCTPGLYGKECKANCPSNCLNKECYVTNGSCIACANGFYDANCSSECFNNCLLKKCHIETGHCFDCKSGYYGFKCETLCPTTCVNNECYMHDGSCAFCQPGYYGKDCTTECSSSCRDQICNFDDGRCVFCSDAFYGDDCSLLCPENCLDSKCESRQGHCFTCKVGFYGKQCLDACPSNCQNSTCDGESGKCLACDVNFYGDLCENSCPKHCLNYTCDAINGTCLDCASGYYGTYCKSTCPKTCPNNQCYITNGTCVTCGKGFYGDDCEFTCPKNCKDNICTRDSGNCLYCGTELYGKNCTQPCPTHCKHGECDFKTGICVKECEEGFYGDFCSYVCSRKCQERTCDTTNGSCFACDLGYYGTFCKRTCSTSCINSLCDMISGSCMQGQKGPIIISSILPIFIGLIMCSVVIVFFCRQNAEYTDPDMPIKTNEVPKQTLRNPTASRKKKGHIRWE